MNKVVIYSITNLINDKRYIGISQEFEDRKRNHLWHLRNNKHGNEKLQNAFNKYGENNFDFEILDEIETDDRMKILRLENSYIIKYDSFVNGYNKSEGFEGSTLTVRSEKWYKIMSERMKGNTYWLGRKQSEEHIAKRTRVHKGKVLTNETRKKISEARMGKYKGEENPFYGKTHTDETKKTIAKKLGKRIRCVDTGEVFQSVSECAKVMNLDRRNIQKVCVGKSKTSKGFRFEFVDE
ncbi:NUMOD3 domain-containing DNA-binding protein [Priestia flexa]|uniref:NUMOD3 domain-containing DNA-binding protein n=1 Tax=Priestia flexa TaxID=86664 RepID=UPI003D291172